MRFLTMRRHHLILGIVTVVVASAASASGPSPERTSEFMAPTGFAVVELFTSEGCSSCPAGEAALGRTRTWARETGNPVFTIAWHVDYWDQLGWPDPYGSPDASDRQLWYAQHLESSRYTPQAIINGHVIADYAGNSDELQTIANRLLAGSPGPANLAALIPLEAGVTAPAADVVRIEFDLTNRFTYEIEAVLVEESLISTPTAGENRGRELHHVSTVRSHARAVGETNWLELLVPDSVVTDNASIVVLARTTGQTQIVAVRVLDMPPPAGPAGVSGRVLHPNGSPVAGIILQFCTDGACFLAETDAAGEFRVELEPGLYVVKTEWNPALLEVIVKAGITQSLEIVLDRRD